MPSSLPSRPPNPGKPTRHHLLQNLLEHQDHEPSHVLHCRSDTSLFDAKLTHRLTGGRHRWTRRRVHRDAQASIEAPTAMRPEGTQGAAAVGAPLPGAGSRLSANSLRTAVPCGTFSLPAMCPAAGVSGRR